MPTPNNNISTNHEPKGSARDLSDTLRGEKRDGHPGQRHDADGIEGKDQLQNASVRRGGEAEGGLDYHPGDPTSPADAADRAAERVSAQKEGGFGDDGALSTYRS